MPIGRFCYHYPQLSLTRAPGILMWKAVRVLWSCRCEVVFQKARLTVNDYLRVLLSEVLKWLAMPDPSLDHEAVRMYAGALQGWLVDRNIPLCEGSDEAGQKRPCPAPQQPDRYFRRQTADRISRKRARVAAEEPKGPDVPHVPEAYTDGPFGLEAARMGFAGYGVWFGPLDLLNMAQPLEGEVKTVNRAELSACMAALVPRGQALRIVTDSRYVYDGILKHLRRWRLQGRPFLNSDLWLLLQAEVDARVAPTLWRHVYRHIGVAGNELADELANQGRVAHPRRRQLLRDQAETAGRVSVVVRTACHTPRRSTVGSMPLFCPAEVGPNPKGGRVAPNIRNPHLPFGGGTFCHLAMVTIGRAYLKVHGGPAPQCAPSSCAVANCGGDGASPATHEHLLLLVGVGGRPFQPA